MYEGNIRINKKEDLEKLKKPSFMLRQVPIHSFVISHSRLDEMLKVFCYFLFWFHVMFILFHFFTFLSFVLYLWSIWMIIFFLLFVNCTCCFMLGVLLNLMMLQLTCDLAFSTFVKFLANLKEMEVIHKMLLLIALKITM